MRSLAAALRYSASDPARAHVRLLVRVLVRVLVLAFVRVLVLVLVTESHAAPPGCLPLPPGCLPLVPAPVLQRAPITAAVGT